MAEPQQSSLGKGIFVGNTSSWAASESEVDKENTIIAVRPVSRSDTTPSQGGSSDQTPWEPGVRKRFPWIGFCAILIIVLCNLATIIVLWHSNGRPASGWCRGIMEPNVFLSIFNNIANLAITVAVANGVAIAWWRRALAGQTMKELHYSWSFSMSFTAILFKLRYFNIIALAALATKVAVIDSVLYQRSLGAEIQVSGTTINSSNYFTFASEVFPYTAAMGATRGSVGTVDSAFSSSLWTSMQSMFTTNDLNAIWECEAYKCQFVLPAAGFSVDCRELEEKQINYGIDAPKALATNQSSGYQNLPLFSMEWSFVGSDNVTSAAIVLNTTYVSADFSSDLDSDAPSENVEDGSCASTLITSICEFRPAVLEYPILITNQNSATVGTKKTDPKSDQGDKDVTSFESNAQLATIRYDSPFVTITDENTYSGTYSNVSRQLGGLKVQKNVDVIEPFVPHADSALYGFYLAFRNFYTASATASWNGTEWSYSEDGPYAFIADASYAATQGSCDYTFVNPIEYLLQQINLFTFGVATDPSNYYDYNSWEVQSDPKTEVQREVYYALGYNNATEVFSKLTSGKNSQTTAQEYFEAIYNTSSPHAGFDPARGGLHKTDLHRQYKDVFFITHWKFAYGAIAATAVVILCIIPVYWKFWALGRKVTLGPFEIANAFQSPAFAGADTTVGEADLVLKQVGKTKVKYVEVTDETGRKYVFQPQSV